MLFLFPSKEKVETVRSRKETRNRLQRPNYADTNSNENIFHARKGEEEIGV